MKTLMILGAIVGLLMGVVLGLVNNSPWPTTLLNASVGAFAMGLMARWWGRVWMRSLREALEKKLAAELAARQEKKAAASAK